MRLMPLSDGPGLPVLVVGPSLGTTAAELWGPVAERLDGVFRVVGWDLPGHGEAPFDGAFTVGELADGLARELAPVAPVHYAGDSLGAAVGLQLLLDHPGLVSTATLCCTGARIGTAQSWSERAATVRESGTAAMVDGSRQRWFAPGFTDRRPTAAERLLTTLSGITDEGYAAACDALAGFDVRDRLGEVAAPVLAVAGEHDGVTAPAVLRELADGVDGAVLRVLPGVAHLAPVEAPDAVAELVRWHASRPRDLTGVRAAGDTVRREVLGAEHVDRAGTPVVGRDFQAFITEYAWGSIWTRPGLARRERSLITLTALVALGHHEELALHLRAALRNGLAVDEIEEALLQTAIYCGVPAANAAFRVAQQVFGEESG